MPSWIASQIAHKLLALWKYCVDSQWRVSLLCHSFGLLRLPQVEKKKKDCCSFLVVIDKDAVKVCIFPFCFPVYMLYMEHIQLHIGHLGNGTRTNIITETVPPGLAA